MNTAYDYQGLKDFLASVPTVLLTATEEIELARIIQAQTIDPKKGTLTLAGQRARNKLVRHNIKWVVRIAQKYRGMPLRDFVQVGCKGLMRAAEKYDPAIGCRFSTYATWWIKQAITRSIQNEGRSVRVPTHIHTKLMQIKKARSTLTTALHREPNDFEVAAHLKMSVKKIRLIAVSLAPVDSIDRLIGDDQNTALSAYVARTEDTTMQAVEEAEMVSFVRSMLENLPERYRFVVCHRYGINCNPKKLDEVGALLGISKEAVRQIEVKAMARLKAIAKFQEAA
ncbi:MAG: sigma-70 family RNA polymerase sigma factor [Verrucomicrobia bacterium]|nr:sigma-70 family RNA polymerase sigma factor [Leptolyngbya sp. ES-bin-22]